MDAVAGLACESDWSKMVGEAMHALTCLLVILGLRLLVRFLELEEYCQDVRA